MFKMYQLTQLICYKSYTKALIKLTDDYTFQITLLMLGYLLSLTIWLVRVRYEKVWLSRMYARFFLVPY